MNSFPDYITLNNTIFEDRVQYYMGNVNQPIYVPSVNNSKIHIIDSLILDDTLINNI